MDKHTDSKNRTSAYTVKEIAEILGIGLTSAYSLIKSGVFRTVRIGRAIRVSRKSFDEWLDGINTASR